MISWPDGVAETPSGVARELVQPRVWSSSVWVTPTGEPWRRTYNPVSRAWSWSEMELAYDAEGTRLGVHVQQGWLSIEQAIATAWLHRAPNSRAWVRVLRPGRPIDVRNLAWGEPDTAPEAGADDETWAPLQWSIGLMKCDARYKISTHGRLWSPHTRTATAGCDGSHQSEG